MICTDMMAVSCCGHSHFAHYAPKKSGSLGYCHERGCRCSCPGGPEHQEHLRAGEPCPPGVPPARRGRKKEVEG